MARQWSKYQLAIFDAFENTKNNLFISATAGSSKSTCLVECARRTFPGTRNLFMAFNKSIAEELSQKLPQGVECSTFHSKGFKVLLYNFKIKPKLNENKTFQMGKKFLRLPEMEFKEQNKYLFDIQTIWNQIRVNLIKEIDYETEIPYICFEKEIEFQDRMIDDISIIDEEWNRDMRNISKVDEFQLDFTDMLYLPYKLIDPIKFPKYDTVMVDESQDLNVLQRELILRYVKPKGRTIIVGDENQCQPTGTKVLLDNGKQINIEDIKVGDGVVCYDSVRDNCFIGDYSKWDEDSKMYCRYHNSEDCKVESIEKRHFVGDLITVKIEDQISQYTPNHICYARFGEQLKDKYVLYLMQKNNWFRIGITPLKANSNAFANRFRTEEADKMWILKFCNSKEEARKEEIYHSYFYGIPQTLFMNRDYSFGMSTEEIEIFYNKFEDLLFERGLALLKLYNRDINFPLLEKKTEGNKLGFNYMFKLYASNLMEGMECIIYDKKNRSLLNLKDTKRDYGRIRRKYQSIDKISYHNYDGDVYSLNVSRYHNYIADNILTHNCIYSFQGASVDNFNYLKQLPNTTILPLSITYRCAKAIVDEAKKIFPENIEASPTATEGLVRQGRLEEATENDFVLCRNNMPLVESFLKFIEMKKRATIKGKDLGEALCRLVDKIHKIDDLDDLLEKKLDELMEKGMSRSIATNNPSYIALEEKCQILKTLHKRFLGSFNQLKEEIQNIFTDNTSGIVLCTCHRSKGLEADRVFFLNPELIPSDHAKTEKAKYAEQCLKFVAITRARKELIYCHI